MKALSLSASSTCQLHVIRKHFSTYASTPTQGLNRATCTAIYEETQVAQRELVAPSVASTEGTEAKNGGPAPA
jgi:hypothetical protein